MAVKMCLASATFPLDKQSVVQYAKKHCSKEDARALKSLEERQYASAEEIVYELEPMESYEQEWFFEK